MIDSRSEYITSSLEGSQSYTIKITSPCLDDIACDECLSNPAEFWVENLVDVEKSNHNFYYYCKRHFEEFCSNHATGTYLVIPVEVLSVLERRNRTT